MGKSAHAAETSWIFVASCLSRRFQIPGFLLHSAAHAMGRSLLVLSLDIDVLRIQRTPSWCQAEVYYFG